MKKAKRSCRGYFLSEIFKFVQIRILGTQHIGLKINHHAKRSLCSRQYNKLTSRFRIA